jgi:hypothetical protein
MVRDSINPELVNLTAAFQMRQAGAVDVAFYTPQNEAIGPA